MKLPIFYVNLDSRSDRRAFMDDQLAELGLAATRIVAATPDDVPAHLLRRHADRRRAFQLSAPQLACTMSHAKAWKSLLDTGADRALVLEDDAKLSKRLPRFLRELPALDFDVIRLEAPLRPLLTSEPISRIEIAGIDLRRFRSTGRSAAAYIISAATATLLLDNPELWDRPVDVGLFRSYDGPGRGLNLVQADPALCVQVGQVSSAGSGLAASDNAGPVRSRSLAARTSRVLRFLRTGGMQVRDRIALRHYKRRVIKFVAS